MRCAVGSSCSSCRQWGLGLGLLVMQQAGRTSCAMAGCEKSGNIVRTVRTCRSLIDNMPNGRLMSSAVAVDETWHTRMHSHTVTQPTSPSVSVFVSPSLRHRRELPACEPAVAHLMPRAPVSLEHHRSLFIGSHLFSFCAVFLLLLLLAWGCHVSG